METKDMIRHGKYSVYLKGSHTSIERVIYEHEGKFYIKFYGELIEVRHLMQDFATVEEY